MKFLKRIKTFLIYSLVISIVYIPNTSLASWSGSAYSPGETLNPECAPTDSGCTVSALSYSAYNATSNTATSTFSGGFVLGTTTLVTIGTTTSVSQPAGSITNGPAQVTIQNTNSMTDILDMYNSSGTMIFSLNQFGNLSLFRHTNNATAAGFNVRRDRAGAILNNADNVFTMSALPYDGTDYRTMATINAVIDGTPSSGTAIPTSWQFSTGSGTSASERMRINPFGNVGIGSTSPYAKLSIVGTAVGTTTLAIRPVTSQTANVLDIYTTGGSLNSVITSSGNWGVGSTSPFATFAINPTAGNASNQFVVGSSTGTSFVIDNSGFVGVGTVSVLNPSGNGNNKMEILGSNRTTSVGNGVLGLYTSDDMAADLGASIVLGGVDTTGGTANRSFAAIAGRKANGTSANREGYLQFAVRAAGSGSTQMTEFMRLNGNGNVGIGTTSPFATLAVNPTAGNASNQFVVGSSTRTAFIIDNSGNVGIGTTTPASRLSLTQTANTPAGGLWIAETGNTDFRSIYMSDTSGTLSFFGGDTAGALNTATLSSAGTWTNASDRSYKENIANLDTKYNLNTLLSIQPRFYTMKGSGKPQIGFIAQELQPILPEVVEGTEGSLGISYGNMVALLVQAIKDINTKVDGLANKFSGVFKTDSVEANTITVSKGIQLVDQFTGSLYCVSIENGEWKKVQGSCTSGNQNTNNLNSQLNQQINQQNNPQTNQQTNQQNNPQQNPESNLNQNNAIENSTTTPQIEPVSSSTEPIQTEGQVTTTESNTNNQPNLIVPVEQNVIEDKTPTDTPSEPSSETVNTAQ